MVGPGSYEGLNRLLDLAGQVEPRLHFFSSRRRHTRLDGDWSSDVCSSDLWQNLILTWSNSLAPALYINGQLDQPSSQWTVLRGTLTNCLDFIVGKGPADSPSSWNGTIDEVLLFPELLTTNEILSISGICPGCTNRNEAPEVDAGTNVTVQIGVPFVLSGTASDDGLPNPPGMLTTTWEQLYTNTI